MLIPVLGFADKFKVLNDTATVKIIVIKTSGTDTFNIPKSGIRLQVLNRTVIFKYVDGTVFSIHKDSCIVPSFSTADSLRMELNGYLKSDIVVTINQGAGAATAGNQTTEIGHLQSIRAFDSIANIKQEAIRVLQEAVRVLDSSINSKTIEMRAGQVIHLDKTDTMIARMQSIITSADKALDSLSLIIGKDFATETTFKDSISKVISKQQLQIDALLDIIDSLGAGNTLTRKFIDSLNSLLAKNEAIKNSLASIAGEDFATATLQQTEIDSLKSALVKLATLILKQDTTILNLQNIVSQLADSLFVNGLDAFLSSRLSESSFISFRQKFDSVTTANFNYLDFPLSQLETQNVIQGYDSGFPLIPLTQTTFYWMGDRSNITVKYRKISDGTEVAITGTFVPYSKDILKEGGNVVVGTGGDSLLIRSPWLSAMYSKLGIISDSNNHRKFISVDNFPTAFGISGTLPAFAATPTFNLGTADSNYFRKNVSVDNLPSLPTGDNTVGRIKLTDGTTLVRVGAGGYLLTFDSAMFAKLSALTVQINPGTTGGLTPYHLVSAATTNATNIKASAGQVYGWYIYNSNAAARKVVFHNTAGTPTAGASVFFSLVIPASSGANVEFTNGIAFSTGIAITTVTGLADSDAVAVAANDLIINIFYK